MGNRLPYRGYRQLKNNCLLVLLQECQKNNLAIREFKRIVMVCRFVFVDLPKYCGSMSDNVLAPRPKTFSSHFFGERQLGAWEQANCHVLILGRGKAARTRAEIANG
jgi:hypothetical protein